MDINEALGVNQWTVPDWMVKAGFDRDTAGLMKEEIKKDGQKRCPTCKVHIRDQMMKGINYWPQINGVLYCWNCTHRD